MRVAVFKQKLVTPRHSHKIGLILVLHGVSACKVACDFWTMLCLIGLWNLFTGLLLSVGIPRNGVSREKPYAFSL